MKKEHSNLEGRELWEEARAKKAEALASSKPWVYNQHNKEQENEGGRDLVGERQDRGGGGQQRMRV